MKQVRAAILLTIAKSLDSILATQALNFIKYICSYTPLFTIV